MYILRIDDNGEKVWEKALGGNQVDMAYSIVEGGIGEYVLAGYTLSPSTGADIYLLGINNHGEMIWEKTHGGDGYDMGYYIVRGQEGGFLAAGWTESLGAGEADAYLVKIDEEGEFVWERTYGGLREEWARSVVQSWEEGYLVAGGRNPLAWRQGMSMSSR